MAKQNNVPLVYNSIKQIRGDWNGVNPVTRIIPNKKKYNRKKKHKSSYEE